VALYHRGEIAHWAGCQLMMYTELSLSRHYIVSRWVAYILCNVYVQYIELVLYTDCVLTTVNFSLFLKILKIRSGSWLRCAWAAQKNVCTNSESRIHALRQPFPGCVRLGLT
jgi:hypothetical protein